jgi:hypothetical protein
VSVQDPLIPEVWLALIEANRFGKNEADETLFATF